MKRFLVLAILGFAAWKGYGEYQLHRAAANVGDETIEVVSPAVETRSDPTIQYRCDGRTYCSQMTSCAEANYFLQNCPGVKMDGNHDGVPCERQWCG